MRIAVVGSSRTRSTLLTYYLHGVYPNLKRHDELYTREFADGNSDLIKITDKLMNSDNYIIKIMDYNLLPFHEPNVFRFQEYDQIHLVERYDFFEQCCSLQISYDTNVWHIKSSDINPRLKQRMMITNRQYILDTRTVTELAKNITCYLKIKKNLLENNIPYTLHTYDQAAKYSNLQTTLVDNKLDYPSLITNYHLKDVINALFEQCFSYTHCTSNLGYFVDELSKILESSESQS